MKDKALNVIETFKSLDHEMAAVSSGDTGRFTELARERKRLEPIVEAAEAWLKASAEMEALESMLTGQDKSMAELAKEEKPAAEARFIDQTQKLRRLLHPRDPRADRNTIIEIRA